MSPSKEILHEQLIKQRAENLKLAKQRFNARLITEIMNVMDRPYFKPANEKEARNKLKDKYFSKVVIRHNMRAGKTSLTLKLLPDEVK